MVTCFCMLTGKISMSHFKYYLTLFLHYCVSMGMSPKIYLCINQSQGILENIMHISGLRCTRCMFDVSVTYLCRLHGECVAYNEML